MQLQPTFHGEEEEVESCREDACFLDLIRALRDSMALHQVARADAEGHGHPGRSRGDLPARPLSWRLCGAARKRAQLRSVATEPRDAP